MLFALPVNTASSPVLEGTNMLAGSQLPAVNMWGGAVLAGIFSELFRTIGRNEYTHAGSLVHPRLNPPFQEKLCH